MLTLIRIGFFSSDEELITRNIARAKEMIEQGGDWERRNRLKVYDAYQCLRVRKFADAAALFNSSLANFSSEVPYTIRDHPRFPLIETGNFLLCAECILCRHLISDFVATRSVEV